MLSVLIPNYGAGHYLKKCIESLYENTRNNFELVVVDDASGPETRELIKSLSDEFSFKALLLDKRHYVNPIWNMAGKLTTGKYIAILNNDITFSPGWDEPLIKQFDDPNVWISNPYQTDQGCMEPYAVTKRTNGLLIRGSGFMMSRDSFNAIFPIPEEMLIWFGDNWICRQFLRAGKKSVFVPESVIHHYGSQSSTQFQNEHGTFNWICRGDAYAYQLLTGEDTSHWRNVIMERM